MADAALQTDADGGRIAVNPHIRPLHDDDMEAVVRLSLAAWAPIFASWEQIMGPEIFTTEFPDWRKTQQETVEAACRDAKNVAIVAEWDGTVAGFLVYNLRAEKGLGEIYLLAVDPDYQNLGIGTALNHFALEMMAEAGMEAAYVGTGGDPGHAPARRAYEKAGFNIALPAVHYYKWLV